MYKLSICVCISGQVLGGHGLGVSGNESVGGPGSTHSSGWAPPVAAHKPQWKGSTQSLRSHGSRKACKFQLVTIARDVPELCWFYSVSFIYRTVKLVSDYIQV